MKTGNFLEKIDFYYVGLLLGALVSYGLIKFIFAHSVLKTIAAVALIGLTYLIAWLAGRWAVDEFSMKIKPPTGGLIGSFVACAVMLIVVSIPILSTIVIGLASAIFIVASAMFCGVIMRNKFGSGQY